MKRFGIVSLVLGLTLGLTGCLYSLSGGGGLPKHVRTGAVIPFENETANPELTGELATAAAACADGVAAAIRAGEFWPPAEMPPDRDPCGALFQHGAVASVAGEVVR